jgi:hypothetical protein
LKIEDAAVQSQRHGVRSAMSAQLGDDGGHVILDRAPTDRQLSGDIVVAEPTRDMPEDLDLSGGEWILGHTIEHPKGDPLWNIAFSTQDASNDSPEFISSDMLIDTSCRAGPHGVIPGVAALVSGKHYDARLRVERPNAADGPRVESVGQAQIDERDVGMMRTILLYRLQTG